MENFIARSQYVNFEIGPQVEILKHRQFVESQSPLFDPLVKGRQFAHQVLVPRILTSGRSKKMIIFHEPSTGKSCVIDAIQQEHERIGYTHGIVVVPGQNLENELKHQFLTKCSGAARFKDKHISSTYTFKHNKAFANELRSLDNAAIRSMYSRKVIYIDEAHVLAEKVLGLIPTLAQLPEIVDFDDLNTDPKVSKNIYYQMMRLFHIPVDSVYVLLTATPMLNHAKNAIILSNMLRPLDQQIAIESPILNMSDKKFYELFGNMFSYIKAAANMPPFIDVGDVIPFSFSSQQWVGGVPDDLDFRYGFADSLRLLIDPKACKLEAVSGEIRARSVMSIHRMGDLQQMKYEQVMSGVDPSTTDSIIEADEIDDVILPSTIVRLGEIGNCAIPIRDDSWTLKKTLKLPDDTEVDAIEWLSNLDNVGRIAAKFKKIIEVEKRHPFCSRVYLESVVGIKDLQALMSLHGFRILKPDDLKSVTVDDEGNITGMAKHPMTVVAIHGQVKNSALIMKIFNSKANALGEYIKVNIGSQVTRDGINYRHCLVSHQATIPWNEAYRKQSKYRVLRMGALDDFYAAFAERFPEKTPPEKIEIFSYASVTAEADALIKKHLDAGTVHQIKDSNEILSMSPDLHRIKFIEQKDQDIMRVTNLIKRSAIECHLNYNRNTAGQDYSADCEYMPCKFSCIEEAPGLVSDVNDEIYNSQYADQEVEKYRVDLIDELKKRNFFLSAADIKRMIPHDFTRDRVLKSFSVYTATLIDSRNIQCTIIPICGSLVANQDPHINDTNAFCDMSFYRENVPVAGWGKLHPTLITLPEIAINISAGGFWKEEAVKKIEELIATGDNIHELMGFFPGYIGTLVIEGVTVPWHRFANDLTSFYNGNVIRMYANSSWVTVNKEEPYLVPEPTTLFTIVANGIILKHSMEEFSEDETNTFIKPSNLKLYKGKLYRTGTPISSNQVKLFMFNGGLSLRRLDPL